MVANRIGFKEIRRRFPEKTELGRMFMDPKLYGTILHRQGPGIWVAR